MKAKFANWILFAFAALFLGYFGTKKQDIDSIPLTKQDLKDFQSDQAENNKTYNGMLYTLNKYMREQQIIDSLNNLKH